MKVHSRGHSTSIGGQPRYPACPQHVRGDALPKDGVMANHSLRRAYAATNAGVDEDTVGKLLNHGGRSVTSRYIKTSYLGRMLASRAGGHQRAPGQGAGVAARDGVNASRL
jgi:hypothetical protein